MPPNQNILDYVVSILLNKSRFCQHGECCGEHIFVQCISTLKMAYGIKTTLSFIGFLIRLYKKKASLKEIISVFLNYDNARFCFFLTSYTLLSKFILCLLRNINDDNKPIYAFYAGSLAGFISLFFLPKGNRKLWALYMLARGLDSKFSGLHKNKYSSMFIFGFMNLISGYSYFFEDDCFGDAQRKTWQQFQNFTKRELQLRDLSNLSVFAK